ncbi:immunoglobulin superfamily member 5 [Solea senegalensis]|nr:immunoglobulin superfamily member 5 [Solea senegalensis]
MKLSSISHTDTSHSQQHKHESVLEITGHAPPHLFTSVCTRSDVAAVLAASAEFNSAAWHGCKLPSRGGWKLFSARFCSAGDTRCVEFTIHNVTRRESGPIMCTVLGEYGSKTAQLYVEETGTINILGGNVTATQDQEVAFQCVTNTWFPAPTITWTLNGHAVDSSLPNTTSVADGDSFNSTSILKFHAVGNTIVACHATVPTSTNPLSSSVFLGVVPKPPDWTVLIAVVLSFGCFALLVLLILGIIFCCKRRKEKQSTYQDEMTRRVRTLSQISSVSVPGQSRGQVNTGFELEGQTSVQAPSELSDHSSRKETVYAMPDIVNSNVHVYANSVNQSGIRKHRHVTIV